jgi:hypothetical protein
MSLRTSSLVLLLLATLSFARPASAGSLSVVYPFVVNYGGGDNAGSASITGPGTSISTGGGGTGCSWCFAGTFLSPGTTLSPSIYYLDFSSFFSGVFHGTTIDPSTFFIGGTTLSAGSFTFPSFEKGGIFTITVPASMGMIYVHNGTQTFIYQVQPGQLRLTFGFGSNQNPQGPVYWFQSGQYTSGTVVTPEPQTLILFGSGLLMITAASFRKYRERGSCRV